MSDEYLPVRINTLRGDDLVSFDVYLKLKRRYVHYNHKSEELEAYRLKKLKSHGVKKLYIKPHDEDFYLKYLEEGLDGLGNKNKDLSERSALAQDTMIMAAENAEKAMETQQGFDAQKKQMDKISEFIVGDRQAIKNMLASAGIAVDNNHHAANVSSLSLALASKMEVTDKVELFELGTAALLHDLGKSRLKIDEFKSRKSMSNSEYEKFKKHSQEGVDMLSGKPYISPKILGLIHAHEELGECKGFPDKKNVFKLPLTTQILILVNKFDHFCIEKSIPAPQAVDPFYEEYGKDFDENLIASLATVLS